MASNRTFTMIKPDAVKNGHIGAILNQINGAGFKIVAMKYTKLSAEKAGEVELGERTRGRHLGREVRRLSIANGPVMWEDVFVPQEGTRL